MKIPQKIAVCSGGFDPLHSGHIAQFHAAKSMADLLVVAINSDDWLSRKKGRSFMPLSERCVIVENLAMVDEVLTGFDDQDGSCCDALKRIKHNYPNSEIIFCNGGDRTQENIPEMSVPGVRFEFGVGGASKVNSSSWILEEWRAPKTLRPWGCYRVLFETLGVKVKELTVDPGAALSMQRHEDRSEFWLVSLGQATVLTLDPVKTDAELLARLGIHQHLHINQGQWHQLVNEENSPLKIVEIQYGERCEENDIERKFANY